MGKMETKYETLISPPPPPWIELPGDVTENILQRLGAEEILKSAEKVCTTWRKICLDPALWRVVHLENQPGDDEREFDLMCRCAVDRSQGQLIDLKISDFGGDKLLNYVARRSNHLRRLRLEYTENISASGLIEAVKKLPQLEELYLFRSLLKLGAKDVETIGMCCPHLKALAYSEDGIALAIAKTMPNLRRLWLAGDEMDNKGLEAILNGCPHLQLLNIFGCRRLDLRPGSTSTLGERCSNQIKFLRLPVYPSYDDWITLKMLF